MTKINRCLAEGRARFRRIVAGSEDGSRCAEMGPLLSAFCDGEAGAEEAATIREHLRACAHCRVTLRTYRAAPAAALLPALPLHRSLFERIHDTLAGLASRIIGGAPDSALQQVGSGGGLRGAGSMALAKAAAICVGTVGGAACLAGGVVPVPLGIGNGNADRVAAEHRAPVRLDPVPAGEGRGVGFETASPPSPRPDPQPKPDPSPGEKDSPPPPEVAPLPTEAAPPPEPAPAPAPVEPPAPAASTGGAAGEFGP